MYPSSCITVIAAPADLFFSLAFFKRSIKSSGALLVKYDSNVCVLVVPGIFPKGHRSCGASNADKLRVTLWEQGVVGSNPATPTIESQPLTAM